jgi:hypothetical protein
MKKQSIILGVIAVVFAATAAFATNAISEASSTPKWYFLNEDDSENCTELKHEVPCTIQPADPCTQVIPSVGMRTIYADQNCTQPLSQEPTF